MKRIMLTAITLLVLSGCNKTEIMELTQEEPKIKISDKITKLPIALKDKGYENFKTTVFKEKIELDQFISKVKMESNWENRENFLNTLTRQTVDFKTNNLLIYSFTEKKGSVVLAVDVPKEINREIIVVIGKEKSNDINSKIENYGLAYLVNKKVKSVIFDNGENNTTIKNSNF